MVSSCSMSEHEWDGALDVTALYLTVWLEKMGGR